METEELFLTFACLLLFFDLIQLLKAKPREKKKLEYGFYALILACGLIVASYFMLLQAFLNDDFALKVVYAYSSSDLPTSHKVYATWAGMSGSMLFLTFLTTTVYFAYRFKTYEKRSSFRLKAYEILDFILIFFLLVTLMNSPFERLQGTPMDGGGLNPLLQTFWMFIHPPIVFSGYVFVIIAFAIILASMRTGEKEEDRLLKLSLQAAWLLLTLGNAVGGLWAYEVLGWGGYWAWDPVETASLLPWLALTAYFHLGPLSRKGKSLTRELMLLITFASVIFTSALTRGGLLVSVHAFGVSPIGPVLLLFALGMTVYFLHLKRGIKKPLFSLEVEKSSLYSVSFFTGYWSLIFIFLICFWGVAFPIIGGIFLENPMTTGADFYNNWSFPFAMTFVAALIGCSMYERIGFKKFTGLVVGALGAGVAFIQVQWPTPNMLANLGIPVLIVALFAVIYRLVRVLLKKKRSLRLFGRSLLHFAIIVTLIGVFFSSTTKQVSGDVLAKPNTTIEKLGLRIELTNFTVYTGTGNVHSMGLERCVPEYSALRMDVAIEQGGSVYHTALWIRYYTLYGIVSPPSIITTWTGDIYVRMLHTKSMSDSLVQALTGKEVLPEDLIVTIETNPMVYLVWAGVTLLSIGAAMPLIKEVVRPVRKKPDAD